MVLHLNRLAAFSIQNFFFFAQPSSRHPINFKSNSQKAKSTTIRFYTYIHKFACIVRNEFILMVELHAKHCHEFKYVEAIC